MYVRGVLVGLKIDQRASRIAEMSYQYLCCVTGELNYIAMTSYGQFARVCCINSDIRKKDRKKNRKEKERCLCCDRDETQKQFPFRIARYYFLIKILYWKIHTSYLFRFLSNNNTLGIISKQTFCSKMPQNMHEGLFRSIRLNVICWLFRWNIIPVKCRNE